VKCAGRRCHGFVHRRCVGLTADEGVPEGWLCPLCDTRGVASKLSVHGGPLARSSPLIGRVLLVPPGAEVLAAASDGSDDDAGRAPLLLRAVGARTRPEAVTADATKPPPSGSRVAVTFDCGEEYEGTVDVALDEKSAAIDFDDGQRENVDFTEGGVRIISGGDVVVRCVALFGDGEETWEISEAAARHAALRREIAEVQAITSMFARGGKYVFQTTTANCERCANCLNAIRSAKSKFHAASGSIARATQWSIYPQAKRNGGPGTAKQACSEKDEERAVALLFLASGAPPPGGGRWLSQLGGLTGPTERPAKSKSRGRGRPRDDDQAGDSDSDVDDAVFGKGVRVVAPWLDGKRYSATVVWPSRHVVRVAFEDGTIHTVARAQLSLDDGLTTYKERDEIASTPRPKKRPKPTPPPPSPTVPAPRAAPLVAPTSPCAICMSMIVAEDAHWLQCGHAFHTDCLREMAGHVRLSSHTRRSIAVSCPLCRKVTRAEVG
jgi:hypothetical protein